MIKKADNIFASPLEQMVDFRFDERVVDVFPDMIQRSVPGYGTLISNIGILAARYAQENSSCYDLGSSLGAVTLSMRQRIKAEGCQIIAVDNSAAMIERAEKIIAADNNRVPVELRCEDINQTLIENASVVVMNFTLQFIAPALRDDLIDKIYQGLKPGGVFILSEKLAFDSAEQQTFFTDAHHDFKRANGYSDLEISQKRSALENVLIPETQTAHQQRLSQAGFIRSECWFQCFNFASLIAFK
ncbi:carboxy-S-adenosyl-L-methionine synthase CmoA [Methylophaga sp.]|uniref:carboxy-S-adenosyl-L-methionine synthase CmoA n=1 Tax=Methylophaga sp. TaxID=2024840 RepID=UPI003A91AB60